MNFLFTPNHVQLLNSCYPPASTLLTAGPDYSPNSQELSRLTYFASNHPGKLTKIGSELEKRLGTECRKARAGNIRTRASLLISLAIFRALATECRRDIALLSPSLVGSVDTTISSLPSDLEVVARAASVFAAWTTYTDGHVIGADSHLTKDYISVLKGFASLSCKEGKDHEVRNRTRLIGFAALTAALNSEALYNDSVQFRAQVSTIMRPVLLNLLQTDIHILEEQTHRVKDAPISPYLAEFRTRPAMERRAASIHVHVDGDKGPSIADVSSVCLHALFSLLGHVNGSQLGFIMRASFDSLDDLNGWRSLQHCCWFAQKTAEWSQYQYRYAVPTWLVERLLEGQDTAVSAPTHKALVTMATAVFNSPIPLINLSTSDIISNLITLLIRRISSDTDDIVLPALVECMSSLGRHVYYSDQIQDLAGEIIGRLVVIEAQGIVSRASPTFLRSRAEAIRCLVAGLIGLIQSADKHESVTEQPKKSSGSITSKDPGLPVRSSRRTRVPPDVWQDTLSLLCDGDYAVRADYADALVFYLVNEMPKHGDGADIDVVKHMSTQRTGQLLNPGDIGTKLLNATHAYLYMLASAPSLGLSSAAPSPSPSQRNKIDIPQVNILPATPQGEDPREGQDSPAPSQNQERRSFSNLQAPRSRKISMAYRLLDHTPSRITSTAAAHLSDYAHILSIITTIHQHFPIRGLLTGIPMMLALDGASRVHENDDPATIHRIHAIKAVLARAWLVVGKVWDSAELIELSEKALSGMPGSTSLPDLFSSQIGVHHKGPDPIAFPPIDSSKPTDLVWVGVDVEAALTAIVSNEKAQEATSLDKQGLLRRFSNKWTAESALRDSIEKRTFDATLRGDGVSPLLKISPALMHIENMSLQSLTRPTRGVGVTDLREALEGRSSMSSSALARPASISTLDNASSSITGGDRLTQTRSRSRSKKRAINSGPGEVRDVLNKLGLGNGKQGGSLLKASFPPLQRPNSQRAHTSNA